MAAGAAVSSSLGIFLAFLLLLSLTLSIASTPETVGQEEEEFGRLGGRVGGRVEIKDVLDNAEVQDLGRFSVVEYNRSLRQRKVNLRLSFSRVVAGQTQVVSGIKYYLKVVVRTKGAERTSASGGEKTYDAVVVVKSWLKSKELVSFIASSPN